MGGYDYGSEYPGVAQSDPEVEAIRAALARSDQAGNGPATGAPVDILGAMRGRGSYTQAQLAEFARMVGSDPAIAQSVASRMPHLADTMPVPYAQPTGANNGPGVSPALPVSPRAVPQVSEEAAEGDTTMAPQEEAGETPLAEGAIAADDFTGPGIDGISPPPNANGGATGQQTGVDAKGINFLQSLGPIGLTLAALYGTAKAVQIGRQMYGNGGDIKEQLRRRMGGAPQMTAGDIATPPPKPPGPRAAMPEDIGAVVSAQPQVNGAPSKQTTMPQAGKDAFQNVPQQGTRAAPTKPAAKAAPAQKAAPQPAKTTKAADKGKAKVDPKAKRNAMVKRLGKNAGKFR